MVSLPIVVLATAWGPRHGGINAFNHDLCKALAAPLRGNRPLVCVVPQAGQGEIDEAGKAGIRLLATGGGADLDSGAVVLAVNAAGHERAAWMIGHDVKTGPVAVTAARLLDAKAAVIHHMNYAAYDSYKSGIGAQAVKRQQEQADLFNRAERCFAVGPALRDSLNAMLADGKAAHMLVPGLPTITPVSPARKTGPFTALVFGRMDQDDDRIKQGRLAVAGVAAARRWSAENAGSPRLLREIRPNIQVIGIDRPGEEAEASLATLSEKWGGELWPQVVAQPFTEDREGLWSAVARAHVVLMPSWHEGFGLTGWEAIAAGVPLIVSTQSGLHQLIREQATGLEGCLWPVAIGGHNGGEGEENFTPGDVARVSDRVRDVAADYEAAVKRAETLRKHLLSSGFTWAETARTMLADLGLNDPPAAPVNGDPAAPAGVLVDRRRPLSTHGEGLESLLLRPESQVVPFGGPLATLCGKIVDWAQDERGSPQKVALRLYADEGGSGKTRLMIESCARLLDRPGADWGVGFLPEGADDRIVGDLIRRQSRLFLVIDYAETQRPMVRAAVAASLRAPPGHRVRIILLCRGRGDWWDLLRQEERDFEVQAFLGSLEGVMGPYSLPQSDAEDPAARQALFENAQQAFRPHAVPASGGAGLPARQGAGGGGGAVGCHPRSRAPILAAGIAGGGVGWRPAGRNRPGGGPVHPGGRDRNRQGGEGGPGRHSRPARCIRCGPGAGVRPAAPHVSPRRRHRRPAPRPVGRASGSRLPDP